MFIILASPMKSVKIRGAPVPQPVSGLLREWRSPTFAIEQRSVAGLTGMVPGNESGGDSKGMRSPSGVPVFAEPSVSDKRLPVGAGSLATAAALSSCKTMV